MREEKNDGREVTREKKKRKTLSREIKDIILNHYQ